MNPLLGTSWANFGIFKIHFPLIWALKLTLILLWPPYQYVFEYVVKSHQAYMLLKDENGNLCFDQ